jgi:hypothetical protein
LPATAATERHRRRHATGPRGPQIPYRPSQGWSNQGSTSGRRNTSRGVARACPAPADTPTAIRWGCPTT